MNFRFVQAAFWGGLFFIVLPMVLSGCAEVQTPPENPQGEVSAAPKQKVFAERFEEVWLACQRALARYPIKINDMDSGVLETDQVRGENAWVSPHIKKTPAGGRRYVLTVNVVKGRVDADGKSAVRVTISKRAELQKDFFSTAERISSDGLEESALLYRVERELQINRALKRSQSSEPK